MQRFLLPILIFGSVGIGIYFVNTLSSPQPKQTRQSSKNDLHIRAVQTAAEINKRFEEEFDKTGRISGDVKPEAHSRALTGLVHIPEDSPNYAQAQPLREQMSVRQLKINKEIERTEVLQREAARKMAAVQREDNRKRVANDADGRRRFATRVDTNYLKRGYDVQVTTVGDKDTILRVQYVLMNRPLAYQIQTETDFLQQAWDVGFKRVILSNGHQTYFLYDAPR